MNPYHGYRVVRNQKNRIIDRIRNLDPGLADGLAAIRLDWYQIRNSAATPDTTEVFVYDEIGGWCGLDASVFVQELNAIETPNITVRINSPGGSLFDGIAIYNALYQHPSHITTRVDALAASAASIIAMAGDEIEMMVGGQLMIHDAMGVEMGNARDMREMADFLDKQSANIATIYAHKAGGDAAEWRDLMLAETWMFAEEAVSMGLADRVYTRPADETDSADGPESEEVETSDEEDAQDEIDSNDYEDELAQLMLAPHKLHNRGYKHLGRKHAPVPGNAHVNAGNGNSTDDLLSLVSNW